MSLYDVPNLSTGLDDAIVDTASTVNIFIPMLLIFIYAVVLLAGTSSQKRRLGTADFPLWSTIAGMSTLMIALPMTLVSGLIQIEILSVVVAFTIFSGIWLFMDKNRYEV